MTREEAIEKLQKQKAEYLEEWVDYSGVAEAYDMAIEALHREEAEEKGYRHRINYTPKPCEDANCDCVDVVRCKDCRHRVHDEERQLYYCEMYYGQGDVSDENYCQWGERREPSE